MIGPISNDKNSPQSPERNSVSEGRSSNQQQTGSTETALTGERAARNDTVNVSRASEILNRETEGVRSSSGVVTTPEQAVSLAATIRGQIEAAGAQALAAQGGIEADQFGNLLTASA